tara:strand:- start:1623 stop:2567 length:945 start_codon:yes stop_codon:yes gene_type:complete
MQPEQQNQAPESNLNAPASSIDAGSVQEPTGKRRWLLVAGGILIFLVVSGAAFLGWLWVDKTAERELYAAVERMMQVEYLTKEVAYSDATGARMDMTIRTDYTIAGQPKSAIEYSLIALSDNDKVELRGEQIALDQQRVAARLSSNTQNSSTADNAWKQIDDQGLATTYDPLGLRNEFNRTVDLVPMGSFSADLRNALMSTIRSNDIYSVTSVRDESHQGVSYKVYELTTDYRALHKLVTKMNELLNIAEVGPTLYEVSESEIWVDQSNNKITKIIEDTQRTTDSPVVHREMLLTYPDSVSITLPDIATSGDKQ